MKEISLSKIFRKVKMVFYLLIPCVIFTTFADFMVTYTVYCYNVHDFASREANQMFRALFLADPTMAAVLMAISSGLILGVIFFIHRLSLFCLKRGEEKDAIFIECSAIFALLYISWGHIVGALSWTTPLPF